MSKRFTDNAIWVDKPWFIELSPAEKCAWFFIKDRCDNVGVWKPNFKMAEHTIGAEINWTALLQKLNSNIEVLKNGKWWLRDFCEYQYGNLLQSYEKWAAGDDIRGPHKQYIELLCKHGLLERVINKGYTVTNIPYTNKDIPYTNSVMGTRQDKDKDKEQDKEKDKDKKRIGAEAKECLDYYFAKHIEVRRFKPTIAGARDITIFKRILKNYDTAAVKEVIDTFFDYDKRTDFSTRRLSDKFDTLYGVLKDKAEGKR